MLTTSTLSRSELEPAPAPPAEDRRASRPGDAAGSSIRVMHVVYRLQAGGMEFGVVKLVNGLRGSRIDSSICSTTPAGEVKALVHPDARIFELRRREGNDPRLVWELYRLFRRERPHIVHTHAWGTLIEGLVAARLAGIRVVVHGEHGTLQLRPHQVRVQRWAFGRVNQVISVSRKLSDRIAATTGFPAARIRTIQNGVDLSRFQAMDRSAARQAIGLEPGAFVIGTAGRLVPVKDHANLIEALSWLRQQGLAFVAVIAGDGPLRSDLVALTAARSLDDRVRFLGHRPDIGNVYAALDVFVLPSRSEGMSNTILEAMASGTPIVATRVGGTPELVEDHRTGRLVPAEDPAALAGALMTLATDCGLRLRMGDAGRAKAEADFSLARMLRDYEGMYAELARARAAGGPQA